MVTEWSMGCERADVWNLVVTGKRGEDVKEYSRLLEGLWVNVKTLRRLDDGNSSSASDGGAVVVSVLHCTEDIRRLSRYRSIL